MFLSRRLNYNAGQTITEHFLKFISGPWAVGHGPRAVGRGPKKKPAMFRVVQRAKVLMKQ